MLKRTTLLTVIALFLAAVAFAADNAAPTTRLEKVEPKTVCMVNERHMAKDQIPVDVDGKTYYGCCEMCKKALATDAAKREAVDPQSNKKVDKATAVIAKQEDGKVFYFENDESLNKWNAKFDKK
jgi:YHS domain-containing protein